MSWIWIGSWILENPVTLHELIFLQTSQIWKGFIIKMLSWDEIEMSNVKPYRFWIKIHIHILYI